VPKSDAGMDSATQATLHIGDVASRTQLSIRSIRHWEEVGLVRPSGRTPGGFRLYSEEDVARIRLLRFMKPLNFTLEQMRELLDLRDRLAPAAADSDDRVSALVWPQSSDAPDDATAADLVRDLLQYADRAEVRLQKLRQQIVEVEEFVVRLREEARRGQPSA